MLKNVLREYISTLGSCQVCELTELCLDSPQKLLIRPLDFNDPGDKARHGKMVSLVERMLDLHKQKQFATSEAARARLEREINITDEQIDKLVYELYGLTEEEIRIVEGAGE